MNKRHGESDILVGPAAVPFSPKTGDWRATCQDKLVGGQIYTGFTPSKEVNFTGVNLFITLQDIPKAAVARKVHRDVII